MSRLLCVGDLHLDKGGRYGRVPGERLAEQEQVWARCLELAREHHVDAVLFAGDAFEKRHPSTDALLAFERPLVEHQVQGGARVIAIPGNHDRSGVSDFCALDVFAEAGLIDLYSRSAVPSVAISMDDDCAIACLPWAPVKRLVAAHDGGDRDDIHAVAAELLLEVARGLRADIPAGSPAILLTHFSITGASLPGGMSSDDLREPVLSLGDLEAIGFDAIVAGHLHPPQELATDPSEPFMPIFYVGSPMPLNFGEGSYEHGVWILSSAPVGPVLSWQPEFVPITSRPFVTLELLAHDILNDGVAFAGGVLAGSGILEGAFVKARYEATAEQARRIDQEQLRRQLVEAGAFRVWLEPKIEREIRARVEGLDETVSDVEVLEKWMTSQSVNGDQAPALRSLHTDYLQEIS